MIYKQDLALNNLQVLVPHKPNQTTLFFFFYLAVNRWITDKMQNIFIQ